MSFNLSVSRTEQFTKEVTVYVHFKNTKNGGFDLKHVTKLDISNSGLVSVFSEEKYICSFVIDDVSSLSFIPIDKTYKDEKYIIYAGDLV